MDCTKILETVTVDLLGCGEDQTTFTIEDTVSDPQAHNAFAAFKAKDQMSFKQEVDGGGFATIIVPFHAIEKVTHSKSSETVDCRPDAYCPAGE